MEFLGLIIALLISLVYAGRVISVNRRRTNVSGSLLVQSNDGQQLVKALPGDAGYDLPTHLPDKQKIILSPHSFIDIPVGLKVKVPDDAWGSIQSRSSTFAKKRLLVLQGVIDSGYTGPLYVFVYNFGNTPAVIEHGDRLAQLIIIPKHWHSTVVVDEMPETTRGERGFGSTDIQRGIVQSSVRGTGRRKVYGRN